MYYYSTSHFKKITQLDGEIFEGMRSLYNSLNH